MIQAFENGSTLYQDASEAILDEYMSELAKESVRSKMNVFDWQFYVQWAPAVLILPILAVLVRQQIRINQISQVVIMLSSISRTHAFELRRLTTTTSLASTQNITVAQEYPSWLINQLWTEISVIDATFFAIVIGLIISITIAVIALWQYAMGRHSYIYIEALSTTDCLQLRVCKLPNASRNFALTHGKITIQIQHFGCIAVAYIRGNLKVTNTLTQKRINAPTTLFLSATKATRMKRILNDPRRQITFMACHSHETVPMRGNGGTDCVTLTDEQQFV
jgi:hypothetical protein